MHTWKFNGCWIFCPNGHILISRWTPSPDLHFYTDAAWLGEYWEGWWLQSHWSPPDWKMDITWKELFAIVFAVHTWGSFWSCHKILFHCDNQAAVDIWEKGSTCATHTMALVCLLYFCAIQHNNNVCLIHLPDVCNDITGSLFLSLSVVFRCKSSNNPHPMPTHSPILSLHSQLNHSWMPSAMPVSWSCDLLANPDL